MSMGMWHQNYISKQLHEKGKIYVKKKYKDIKSRHSSDYRLRISLHDHFRCQHIL